MVLRIDSPQSFSTANDISISSAPASKALLIPSLTKSRGLEKSYAISINSCVGSTLGDIFIFVGVSILFTLHFVNLVLNYKI